jgi:type I restriction enzyme, S subunit
MEQVVPKLRFPEFMGSWKKKNIGSLGSFFSGGTPTSTNKTYYEGQIPFIGSGKINDSTVDQFITDEALSNSSAKLVEIGDLLYALYGATSGEVAISKINGAINQAVLCIRTDENKIFLKSWFEKNKENILSTFLQGGQGNLSAQIVKSLIINLPLIQEQTKIASFLTVVDNKIQALKQKKTLLEEYKKGVMQKIFSHELRFKDDNGNEYPDWEEKKLGEVLVKNSKKNKNQEFKLVQSVSNKRGFVNQDEYFEDRIIASKDLSNYYVIQKGDFAYNPSRIDVGSLAYKFDNNISVISPLYISFKAVGVSLVDAFLLEWFTTQQFTRQMNSSFEGSVRNTLSYESLRKIEITFPSLEEQTKIANFLSAIDDKINHCNSQIEKIEVWKKGLLQQMFC